MCYRTMVLKSSVSALRLLKVHRSSRVVRSITDNTSVHAITTCRGFCNAHSRQASHQPSPMVESSQNHCRTHLPTPGQPIRCVSAEEVAKCELEPGWPFTADDDMSLSSHRAVRSGCDVCVIGGGVVGAAIAFWLSAYGYHHLKVTLVERDLDYSMAASVQSLGGVRPQFSLAENIQMSVFGAHFLRYASRLLSVPEQPPISVDFHPAGSLVCADASTAARLLQCSRFQSNCGAMVQSMTQEQLAERFPWLNVDGVEAGSWCLDGAGWFSSSALMSALLGKAAYNGAAVVEAEVAGLEASEMNARSGLDAHLSRQLNRVILRARDGRLACLNTARVVVAAGASSAAIMKLVRCDELEDDDQENAHVMLPLRVRKRFVYRLQTDDGPALNFPFVSSADGRLQVRSEGRADGCFLCVHAPAGTNDDPEPSAVDLNVPDAQSPQCGGGGYFDTHVRPMLAQLVPSLHNARLVGTHAGLYDSGSMDGAPLIGRHPVFSNVFVAAGLGGTAAQHAPAIGRAISEMVMSGDYESIDLSRFSLQRFAHKAPVHEDLPF